MKSENARQIIDYAVMLTAPLPQDADGLKKSRILVMGQLWFKEWRELQVPLLEAAAEMGMVATYTASKHALRLEYHDLQMELTLRASPPGNRDRFECLEGSEFTACILDHRLYGTPLEVQLITRCGRYPSYQVCRDSEIVTMILTDKLA